MRRCVVLIILACLNLFPTGLWSDVNDGRIIISRQDKTIDVFVTLPGDMLEQLTGTGVDFLTNDDGKIDLNSFRVDTAPLGDRAFAPVIFGVGGDIVDAQAIALMMHAKDDKVPFDTPWDALTAVTLCIAPEDAGPAPLAQVQAYVGLSLYPVAGMEDLHISFPQTHRADMRFDVLTFVDGSLVSHGPRVLPDGGTLTFEGALIELRVPGHALWLIMCLVVALFGGVLWRSGVMAKTQTF